ncbi:hypothetical protein MKX01_032421 [Papaver californicum]|nr:hypothetical protein MKX01_032421 [Papaver californicum]
MLISFFSFFSLCFVGFSSFFLVNHLVKFWSSTQYYGPKSYPLIGCLISFYKNRFRLLDWYTDLLAQSPTQSIVVKRFGARRTIVTANPDNVNPSLKLGRGIFNVDGELWRTQRKIVSHGFTTKSLKELVAKTLQEEVKDRLLPILESAAKTGLDMQELLRRFAFDVVCKVSLGTDPGCLEPSLPISPLATTFDIASMISARRGAAPLFIIWKIKRALKIGTEKTLKEAIELSKKEKLKQLQEKDDYNVVDSEEDLLSRIISAGHDEEFISDMVISFIMEGRDTTSAAMTWLFWALSLFPNVEADLVKEYPPVAWNSKHPLVGDVLPDGTRVQSGDRVTYFPYGMGRMEELRGKDRLEFKPDRWFVEPDKVEGGVLRNVSPYKFPVFQAGPRVCLGKEMAFIQMKYVVSSILNRFQLRPVMDTDKAVFVPLLTAHMAGGFNVKVIERDCKSQI